MKRSRYLIILLVTAISLGFGSCLKDKAFLDVSNTSPVIEFGQSIAQGITNDSTGYEGAFYFAGDSLNAPVATYDTAIALVLASPQVLNDSISVTLAVDPTQIPGWNAQPDTATLIPDSLYSLPQLTVGISPQHRVGNFPVNIFLSKFIPVHDYALPLKIVSATDVTHPNTSIIVSGNSGTFMWLFTTYKL
jgi:Domain of unknown function (DUF1735)